jgi:hypothetical protein
MRNVIFLAISLAIAPAAMAQGDLMGRVVACAGIDDAAKRHACFDVLTPELRGAPEKAFGERSVKSSSEQTKIVPVEPDKVSLKVSAITRGADGGMSFTMENGQVWTQTEAKTLAGYGKGPWNAEIRKAMGGSFLMQVNGGGSIRVKRVK